MLPDPGIYLHFPWCVRKCPYCDFNSHPLKQDTDKDHYVAMLGRDLASQKHFVQDADFASVFLGGGTPSLFSPADMAPILEQLPLQAAAEVTMEANPGTAEHADFSGYRSVSINRLSIGAQSFNNEHLQALGRIHDADETMRAFDQARRGGFDNINVDLMWGLPGQSVEQAMADLATAIALSPEHISWYQLTIEPRTEFARRQPLLPVEETLYAIEQQGLAALQRAGYQRYEVSAFARPGKQCQHNLNYWRFGDYMGIGAGAHGKITTRQTILRTSKARQPRLYQQDPEQIQVSPVAGEDLPVEFAMNALRLIDGVPFEHATTATRLPWSRFSTTWAALQKKGLVRDDRCATTPLGLRYLDSAVEAFLAETPEA